jgi:hypothetical protein
MSDQIVFGLKPDHNDPVDVRPNTRRALGQRSYVILSPATWDVTSQCVEPRSGQPVSSAGDREAPCQDSAPEPGVPATLPPTPAQMPGADAEKTHHPAPETERAIGEGAEEHQQHWPASDYEVSSGCDPGRCVISFSVGVERHQLRDTASHIPTRSRRNKSHRFHNQPRGARTKLFIWSSWSYVGWQAGTASLPALFLRLPVVTATTKGQHHGA